MFILGLDLGTKRMGVALADTKTQAVFMLPTIHFKNIVQELKPVLLKIINQWEVEAIVVGLPLSFNLETTQSSDKQANYVNQIKKLGLPVYLENEMFTSKEAEHIWILRN